MGPRRSGRMSLLGEECGPCRARRRKLARLCRVMSLGAGVLAAAVAATSAPASAGRLLLFGAEELGSRDIGYFPQWTSTLGRLAVAPAAWTAPFEPLRQDGGRGRITAVTGRVNRKIGEES